MRLFSGKTISLMIREPLFIGKKEWDRRDYQHAGIHGKNRWPASHPVSGL
jgi:hypothetical protein